ncbi:cyclic-phosphate processing receiver domain-containing protein [Empedobacter falsenii]|uniref:cyclic-phosphate processing receiver domain-containing protein n=1 Tax=Empedobacter falsenii TaxID=343874 RepID=UPI003306C613
MKKYFNTVFNKYFQVIPPERLNRRVPKRFYKLFVIIILLFIFIVLIFLLTQLILITYDKLYLDNLLTTPNGFSRDDDYDDFVNYINRNGLPDFISFDHDLGLRKTGYDCAKFWLIIV